LALAKGKGANAGEPKKIGSLFVGLVVNLISPNLLQPFWTNLFMKSDAISSVYRLQPAKARSRQILYFVTSRWRSDSKNLTRPKNQAIDTPFSPGSEKDQLPISGNNTDRKTIQEVVTNNTSAVGAVI
jgi:hypothetical protein